MNQQNNKHRSFFCRTHEKIKGRCIPGIISSFALLNIDQNEGSAPSRENNPDINTNFRTNEGCRIGHCNEIVAPAHHHGLLYKQPTPKTRCESKTLENPM